MYTLQMIDENDEITTEQFATLEEALTELNIAVEQATVTSTPEFADDDTAVAGAWVDGSLLLIYID